MARMNHEEFLNKMQEKFDLCMKEARAKNPDYASHGKEGASGLQNFYETAEESGITPLQAWHTHFYKHYLAIRQAVRGKELRSETLAGRFKDAAVYNIIGWLLVEEMEAEKAEKAEKATSKETYTQSDEKKPYHGVFPPPLGSYTEPRFHTAKDTQVDAKTPDGVDVTSERWYVIDAINKKRLRVHGGRGNTVSENAYYTCADLNRHPECITEYNTWEPFPAT